MARRFPVWKSISDRFGFIAVTLAIVQACSPGTEQTGVVRRDSAGVAIIESNTPRWSEGRGWTVDPTPTLDLSTSGTGLDHEFFRVSDARFLPEGHIVVANAGTDEIRLYSSAGSLIQSVGREGEGPQS